MTIKLIALDLDGTILDSSKQILDSTKKVIREYAQKGIKFTYCTGRIASEMKDIITELPEVQYAVTCNGAFVTDLATGNTLGEGLLGMPEVIKIYNTLSGFDKMFELMTEDKVLTDEKCLSDVSRYGISYIEELILKTRVGVDEFENYLKKRERDVGKVNIFFSDGSTRDRAKELVKDFPLDISIQEPTNLEFNRTGVNKGFGLGKLAEYLGISKDEIMAIGDNNNDIPMMAYAGIAVAMENAADEVKSAAKFVTKSNNEDGVAYALENFLCEKGENV